MKQAKKLFLLTLVLLMSACSSIYRQAGLDTDDRSQFAVIELASCGDDCPIIQEVDGKWRGVGMFKEYELKPGERKVKFIYVKGFKLGVGGIVVKFKAKKGEIYSVRANANYSAMTWNPKIYEKKTGLAVSTQVGASFTY